MSDDRALIDELLRHRLELISKELPELKLAFDGNQLILNVCVAYSRQVARENVLLKERLDKAETKLDAQENDISELRVQAVALADRVEGMAQWAKTKGKT